MPINPSEFVPKESRWADIFNLLKTKGVNVKSPTTNIGVITQPTVIVRNSGVMQHNTFTTEDFGYEVVVCVPESQYSKLEPLVVLVREYMKDLYPMVIDSHEVSASMYDEEIRAHYMTVAYKNYRRFHNY